MSIYDDIAKRKGEKIYSSLPRKTSSVKEVKALISKEFPKYKMVKKQSAAPADKTRTSR